MKSLKQYLTYVNEAKNFEMPAVKLTKLSVDDLHKYISICKEKFLSKETLDILKYMEDNFAEGKEITHLDFINSGWDNGELSSSIKEKVVALNKAKRTKELPMYLTDNEFKDVINMDRPLDFYVYDLVSQEGRNELVKRFEPMLKNAAYRESSKVGMDYEEMYSAGLEGFTYALNNYGKLRSEYVRQKGLRVDIEKFKKDEEERGAKPAQLPFASYATAQVVNAMNEYQQNEMNLVRRPKSEQRAEKKKTGGNKKQGKVSGDASIGNDKDGNARQMWDKLGDDMDSEAGGQSADNRDIKDMWKEIFDRVEKKFGKDIAELWYVKNGLNGREYKKFTASPNDYYKINLIKKYLVTDPVCKKIINELHELMLDN